MASRNAIFITAEIAPFPINAKAVTTAELPVTTPVALSAIIVNIVLITTAVNMAKHFFLPILERRSDFQLFVIEINQLHFFNIVHAGIFEVLKV